MQRPYLNVPDITGRKNQMKRPYAYRDLHQLKNAEIFGAPKYSEYKTESQRQYNLSRNRLGNTKTVAPISVIQGSRNRLEWKLSPKRMPEIQRDSRDSITAQPAAGTKSEIVINNLRATYDALHPYEIVASRERTKQSRNGSLHASVQVPKQADLIAEIT